MMSATLQTRARRCARQYDLGGRPKQAPSHSGAFTSQFHKTGAALILVGAGIFTFGVHNIHEVVGHYRRRHHRPRALGATTGFPFRRRWITPVLDGLSYLVALKVLGGGFGDGRWRRPSRFRAFIAFGRACPTCCPTCRQSPAARGGARCVICGHRHRHRDSPGCFVGGDDVLALSI